MFIFLLFLLLKSPNLDSEVIISNDLSLETKIMVNRIPYTLVDNEFLATPEEYIRFTEGYIQKDTYDNYRSLLDDYDPTYLHEVYEDEQRIIFCYVSGVYIIDKYSKEVSEIDCKLYISHVRIVDEQIILLGYKPHSTEAMAIYVSLDNFEIIDTIIFDGNETPHQYDFTISANGEILLLDNNLLTVCNNYDTIPLLLKMDYILNSGSNIVLLNSDLDLMILDENFNEIFVGEVPRPCEESTLVDIMVSDDYLSIVSFDHTQAKFPNYICTYDLTEPKLISAIGLKEAIPPSFLMP